MPECKAHQLWTRNSAYLSILAGEHNHGVIPNSHIWSYRPYLCNMTPGTYVEGDSTGRKNSADHQAQWIKWLNSFINPSHLQSLQRVVDKTSLFSLHKALCPDLRMVRRNYFYWALGKKARGSKLCVHCAYRQVPMSKTPCSQQAARGTEAGKRTVTQVEVVG